MGDLGDKLKGYTIIKEGEAEILLHSSNAVFFNKAQVNNRDMSIAVLRAFIEKRKEEHAATVSRKVKSENNVPETASSVNVSEGGTVAQDEAANGDVDLLSNQSMDELENISKEPENSTSSSAFAKERREPRAPKVLEALAASGLRALRYAREVDGIGQVVALDNDKGSVEACKKNIQFNGSAASSKMEVHLADARIYMLTHQKEFDVGQRGMPSSSSKRHAIFFVRLICMECIFDSALAMSQSERETLPGNPTSTSTSKTQSSSSVNNAPSMRHLLQLH